MESVYLETTFISYLVARPSRDLLVAAHQQTTQEWWAERRHNFNCYISQVVVDEASLGDPAEIQKRLEVIASLAAVEVNTDAETLAQAILSGWSDSLDRCPRCRPYSRRLRPQCRLPADVELPALGKCPNSAENIMGL